MAELLDSEQPKVLEKVMTHKNAENLYSNS